MSDTPAVARAKELLAGVLDGRYADEAAFIAESVGHQREAAMQVLKVCGDAAKCTGCNATIFWMVSKNGKKIPFDPEGCAHWATCPKAADFRKTETAR